MTNYHLKLEDTLPPLDRDVVDRFKKKLEDKIIEEMVKNYPYYVARYTTVGFRTWWKDDYEYGFSNNKDL